MGERRCNSFLTSARTGEWSGSRSSGFTHREKVPGIYSIREWLGYGAQTRHFAEQINILPLQESNHIHRSGKVHEAAALLSGKKPRHLLNKGMVGLQSPD
jgi:hypothetical protein